MDNNNLDIEIVIDDLKGNVISYETLREIMVFLLKYKDQFLDIIVTLCHVENHKDLLKGVLDEFCEDFCFEMVVPIQDFDEEWAEIYRDFGILPLFYIDTHDDEHFDDYLNVVKERMNTVEGHCRAVVFVPHSSKQLERLPEVYNVINNVSLVPCFMRLKFKEVFEVSPEAIQIYHDFIDKILPEYVLFGEDNVQYYNLNNNVRFRTLECPKNYIYRLRLSANSNACVISPDKSFHHIGMTEKFFPGKLPIEKEMSYEEFDFLQKSFMLKDGMDRMLYKFQNPNCGSCRLKEYCHDGVGNDLQVPDSFCDQLRFFSYGYFKLKDLGDDKDLKKYPIRIPMNGIDQLGMFTTVSQLGAVAGVIPPFKLMPGNQIRYKKNFWRLSENIDISPILLTRNVIEFLKSKDIMEKLKNQGVTEENVDKVLNFIKKYNLRVYFRDLGVYHGRLYIYRFVPVYKNFEQIDNLLFDKKTKKRVPNKARKAKMATT